MKTNRQFRLLIFLSPFFLGLFLVWQYRECKRAMVTRLVQSGAILVFDGGTVTRDDIKHYFQIPPGDDCMILRALEMTLEDVTGLDREDREWFNNPAGQFLLSRVIKHLALVNYLNARFDAADFEDVESEIQKFQETLMIECMENELAQFIPTVTKQEMLAYYLRRRDQYYQEGSRLARHIMLSMGEPAEGNGNPLTITPDILMKRLQNGEDFQSLAPLSRSDSKANSGELGWLPRGALAPSFDRALRSLAIGEITGPVQVGETIHFIQLLDKQPEGMLAFEECAVSIQKELEEEKRKRQRYKLLHLSEDTTAAGTPDSAREYREALLKAAGQRKWDQNSRVVKQTAAFARYRRADILFNRIMKQRAKKLSSARGVDESWTLEEETAQRLLKQMNCRYLVKLDLPLNPVWENEPEMERESRTVY